MLLGSLTRRRSRGAIAVVAIAIGAITLTGLIAILTDIPRQMELELRASGANLVVVPNGQTSIPDADAQKVDAIIPVDARLGEAAFRYETLRINDQPYTAAGVEIASVKAVRPYWQLTGAWPAAGQVLIGRDIATATNLGVASPVGLTTTGKDGKDVVTPETISGVTDTGDDEDSFIVMPRSDLDKLMGTKRGPDVLEYSVSADADTLATLASTINAAVPQVTASPVKRLAHSETTVLGTLTSLLAIVTVVALALTLITVATTMMAVVAERRTEIGLRKALGADDRSIVADFLAEGLVLGAVGGLIGGAVGLGFAQLVSRQVFSRGIPVRWWLVAVSVAVSIIVTVLACWSPVRRAARVDPVVVLREE